MLIVRTQVTPLTLWPSHSADECLCWLPMHACKPTRLWTPCWRTLLIFSQVMFRCTTLQQIWAASSGLCRQHGRAFSVPDMCMSASSACIHRLLPGALALAFNFSNWSSVVCFSLKSATQLAVYAVRGPLPVCCSTFYRCSQGPGERYWVWEQLSHSLGRWCAHPRNAGSHNWEWILVNTYSQSCCLKNLCHLQSTHMNEPKLRWPSY